LTKIELNSVMC